MIEQSTYFWYVKTDRAPALAQSGCNSIWIKAGGDGSGRVWTQWSAPALAPFISAKIAPEPWFFVQRDWQTDVATIGKALAVLDAPRLVLNVEIGEGGWDGATATEAQALVAAVRQISGQRQVGFSSCPSWDGDPKRGAPFFPYEAFCQLCDFSMPQQYWTGAPDQVAYEVARNRTGKPVIPILWGEWDDATLAQQAQHCRDVLGAQFGGLSAWEAGNVGYNLTGMGAVYGALSAVEALVSNTPIGPYNITLGGGFRKTYEDAGDQALTIYGWPVTGEFTEVLEDGKEYTVQYFERDRMQYDQRTGAITFGLCGLELAQARGYVGTK